MATGSETGVCETRSPGGDFGDLLLLGSDFAASRVLRDALGRVGLCCDVLLYYAWYSVVLCRAVLSFFGLLVKGCFATPSPHCCSLLRWVSFPFDYRSRRRCRYSWTLGAPA